MAGLVKTEEELLKEKNNGVVQEEQKEEVVTTPTTEVKQEQEVAVTPPAEPTKLVNADIVTPKIKKFANKAERDAEKARIKAEAEEKKQAKKAERERIYAERKAKKEAERAEWKKQVEERKQLIKQANQTTLEDRSNNALRDYGRYLNYNSYGKTFDQEQLQTSMQPEDIRAFQRKHGIPATGWVGRRTYLKLKEEWEKQNGASKEPSEADINEAEKAAAEDPSLSPAEQKLRRDEFAKNAEIRKWVHKWKTEDPKDFPPEAVLEGQAILNKYGYNTKLDDKFGTQTMWHFFQALATQDPELEATFKQAGIKLGEDGSVIVERPYDHIMDYLNDKSDRERAMYERDYALRKSERDRKMQSLNDMFSMIKDTVVASGGVMPEKRDTSDKYEAINKYAKEANDNYRKYEEDRRQKLIEMAKANEDERQRRQEKDAENKKWQQEFDEKQRMNNVNVDLEREKMQLAREEFKLKKELGMLDAETKKAYYDIMGNYYATKGQVESVKAAQKALGNKESVVAMKVNNKDYVVPTTLLIKLGANYGVDFSDNVGDPAKAGLQVYQDIMTKIGKKGNAEELLKEFENRLENELLIYNNEEPLTGFTANDNINRALKKGKTTFEETSVIPEEVEETPEEEGVTIDW